MEKITQSPISKYHITPFCIIGAFVALAIVCEGDAAVASLSNEVTSLKKIFEIDTTQYLFSNGAANPTEAEKVCEEHAAKLLAIQTPHEFKLLSKKLKDLGTSTGDSIWTSGISFTNATIENRLIWSSYNEPFTYSEFHESSGPDGDSSGAMKRKIVRNKRASKNDDCDCDCTTTPMPPFPTLPPCKVPQCTVEPTIGDPCEKISPPDCSLAEDPKCDVTERKCSVECGDCRVTQQPVCEVVPSSKPRCRLEMPKCDVGRPNCTIIAPSVCHAVQDDCIQEPGDSCKPIIKPCKNSCADSECTTISPPCTVTQPPCETTTVCPPNPPPDCKTEKRCRSKRSGKGDEVVCENIHTCSTPPPITCGPVTTCPPKVTDCPNPVTACTRPFVDCSPEICQSMVHLCLPRKFRCPPVRIICESPKVDCLVDCLKEPEVICDLPEVKCSKPKVDCPPAHVQCDRPVTTCDLPKFNCGHPEAIGCAVPNVTCEAAVTCPPSAIPPGPTHGCGSGCGNKCGRMAVEGTTLGRGEGGVQGIRTPSEVEIVEKTMCIAIKPEFGFKWVLQSCNLQHKYICEREKVKGGSLKGYFDNMVIG